MTGFTIMGWHFQEHLKIGVAHFRDFGDQKIQVGRDLKMERFLLH